MMKSQRSNIERGKLIKDGVKMGIGEINKLNGKINDNFQKRFFVCIYKKMNLDCKKCLKTY